jgi:aspartyl-tRNA synthetase
MEARLEPKTGDIIFFSANEFKRAVSVLNIVRLALRDKFELADKNKLSFAWIVDFPMFQQDPVT